MRNSLRPLLLTLALLLAAAPSLQAQRLSLFNIDTSGFPDIRAEISILDEHGIPITGYTSKDFTVTENGEPVDAVVVSCPTPVPARPASFVLVTDRSGSMLGRATPDMTRFDLVREALRAFVTVVQYSGQTSVAITMFDAFAAILSDFQTSAPPLLDAIEGMMLGGLTNYDVALRDSLAGGIPLLKSRPDSVQRVLIFLTDGTADLLGYRQVINDALNAKITIYVITIGMTVPNVLREIAEETGGMAYGNVNDPDEITALYAQIATRTQGNEPCKLSWRSRLGCGYASRFRQVRVTLNPLGLTRQLSYTAPERSYYGLRMEPRFLWFGAIAPPDTAQMEMTITAQNGDVKINTEGLPPGSPFTVTDWGGSAPPFTLAAGTARTLKIRFSPPDSSIYTAALSLSDDPCRFEALTLSGGVRGSTRRPGLRLLAPIGGESYSQCDSVMIRWAGNALNEKVKIEYSSNNGTTWRLIADSVVGSFYNWAPPGGGTAYRVRISIPGGRGDSINTFAGGGPLQIDDIPATDASLFSPKGVTVSGSMVYFSESGGHRVKRVDMTTGLISTVAGTGQSGSSNGAVATMGRLYNPTGVAISGSDLYIADYSNHLVRSVDLTTGVMKILAGNGQSGISGDGGPAKNARLYFPSDVVVSGRTLYIADSENGRVRGVDLNTGIISTVAGGGDIPVADGGLATKSLLVLPTSLAIDGDSLYIAEEGAHRIRRVDLRTGVMATVAGDGTEGASADGLRADSSQISRPNGVTVAGNNLIFTEAGNHRIRVVDRRTKLIRTLSGTRVAGYSGDGGPARPAQFNKPARIAADDERIFIADPLNGRIRVITIGNAGRADSSRKSFTVAAAQITISLAGRSADLGTMRVGAERDSVLNGTLCNRGTLPLYVDSMRIIGANASDFQLVSGLSSTPLGPSQCRNLEIRFRPSAQGKRSAAMIFLGRCGGADTLWLSGTGGPSCGDRVLPLADLGAIIVGTTRPDTLLRSSICNSGPTTLSGEVTLRQSGTAFTLVSGGGSYSLSPGDCHDIVVRYAPTVAGRATAEIDYGLPTGCGVTRTRLYARGLRKQQLATDSLLTLRPILCPSEERDTVLLLRNFGETPLGITGIEFAPGADGFSILSPIPSAAMPRVIQPEGTDTLRIRFAPATPGARSAILTITSDGSAELLRVTITGRKDSLRIAPDVSLISFAGDRAAGSYPLDTTILLRNTGTVPVTITAGTISGAGSGAFEFPAGQLPLTIAPGQSALLHVRALAPATGSGSSAMLALLSDPGCGIPLLVQLIEGGAEPLAVLRAPAFRDLLCVGDTVADTTIIISNPGGSELRITGYRIEGADASSFIFTPPLPIVIPPGESRMLPIRFAPATPGARSARLVLTMNGAGDSVANLAGRRELVAYDVSPGLVSIGPIKPGISGAGSFTLTNNGTRPVTLAITKGSGGLAGGVPGSVTLQPGAGRTINVVIGIGIEGIYRDTLTIVDDLCGIRRAVAIEANISDPTRTIVSLPVDSAGPGTRVRLPIRIAIPDRGSFQARNARTYRATIVFLGIVFFHDTTIGARTVSSAFDRLTALQTVTIEGDYTGGDTLAILGGEALASDSTRTLLHITSFTWDKPGVAVEARDGIFSVSEECSPGRRLSIRPRVLKIRPMPVGADAVVEIALDEAVQLRASLIDGMGREVALVADRRFPAGPSSLDLRAGTLPSGMYTLRLSTPFGEENVQVMVVH